MDKEIKTALQAFNALLNKEPDPAELDKTPDGKAQYLPISFVEMTLDEIFYGLWSTEHFTWSGIANEVQGKLELVLTHPVTGQTIRRTGAASIVITVDALSQDQKNAMTAQQRNTYALSPENKKPNALDLAFPKLKSECIKNAAASLGKRFGRDVNRRKADIFKPEFKRLPDEALHAAVRRVEEGKDDPDMLIERIKVSYYIDDIQMEMIRNSKQPLLK